LGGWIETGALETSLLREPLEFRVYLPPCYLEEPGVVYPVLYLIHGQSYTDDQWERLGVSEIADTLIASGELPPFLIVMPRDRRWSEPAEDLFGRAVVEALIPWIDEQYATQPDRAWRAIGGLSRGGAWALHLGLSQWELFGAIGMHSGFAFHSDIPYIKQWLDAIPIDQIPRFYLDVGDHDRPPILESATWFESLLTQRGIAHQWRLFSGYHDEIYWAGHAEEYLRWYAQPWQPKR
jgi:enterochelin esterase-like enzyme